MRDGGRLSPFRSVVRYRKSDPLRAMAMEEDDGPRWSAEPSPRKRKLSESKAASGPAKPISIRQSEPTSTHLRSSMVHRTLPLKQKQLLQVAKKCEDLQLGALLSFSPLVFFGFPRRL